MRRLLLELLDLLTFHIQDQTIPHTSSPQSHGVYEAKSRKILRLHPVLYKCLRNDVSLLLEVVTRVGWEAEEVQRTLLPVSRIFRAAEKTLGLPCGALSLKAGRRLYSDWRLGYNKS